MILWKVVNVRDGKIVEDIPATAGGVPLLSWAEDICYKLRTVFNYPNNYWVIPA
jgi:hypothetical protein